jgi:hypothetical protein
VLLLFSAPALKNRACLFRNSAACANAVAVSEAALAPSLDVCDVQTEQEARCQMLVSTMDGSLCALLHQLLLAFMVSICLDRYVVVCNTTCSKQASKQLIANSILVLPSSGWPFRNWLTGGARENPPAVAMYGRSAAPLYWTGPW